MIDLRTETEKELYDLLLELQDQLIKPTRYARSKRIPAGR